MRSGLLLAVPLESVAVRLALALGVALVLLRIVSAWELRSPRARSTLAVSPFVVAATVVLLSSSDLGLPALLVPASAGAGALAVPVADRYLDFVPVASLVVGLWAALSLSLLALRMVRSARFRRSVLAGATPAEPRVAALVLRLSRALAVTPPRVLVVADRVGGAAVLGVRSPLLLLDVSALEQLDDGELEGVIAHELAHIARRDNLVAWAVAAVRDVAFFVPGARWAMGALHREREAAADHDAVAVTGRPAALASGLLRVVEIGAGPRRAVHGCAALVPAGSVVDRVNILLRETQPTAREHRVELSLAAAVSLVAVALAVVVPGLLTGAQGERDAIGILVGSAGETGERAASDVASEGRVFSVYRSLAPAADDALGAVRTIDVRASDLIGPEDRPGMALACAAGAGCSLRGGDHRLVLRPAPIVLLDDPVMTRWQATPVSEAVTGDRFGVYWLARLVGSGVGG